MIITHVPKTDHDYKYIQKKIIIITKVVIQKKKKKKRGS
jgi:hypothetical protein